MSYDPKCDELARHFLEIDTPEKYVSGLAQSIQDCIESYIEEMRNPTPEL